MDRLNNEAANNLYTSQPEGLRKIEANFVLTSQQPSVKTIKNGIILPARRMQSERFKFDGGVVDENYNFVAGLIRKKPKRLSNWELNHTVYKPESYKKIEETVIFGGVAVTHFGHFLLDGMTRLWYYLQNPEAKKYRLAIILIPLWKSYAWIYDFLSMLDIKRENIIIVDEPTQFSNIVIPDESAHTMDGIFTKEYMVPFKYLTSHAKASPLKKIFLSKTSWNVSSDMCNEEYFRRFYEKKGFVSIHIESFSLAEQVGIMFNADEVVSTSGTLSHLALFCRPTTKFTILAHSDLLRMLEYSHLQMCINKLTGINCVLIDVSQNFLYNEFWRGVHLIGPNQHWKKYVLENWNEEIDDDSLDTSAADYIRKWLLFYENHPHPHALTDYYHANNPETIFMRLYQVFFGKKPSQRVTNILHNEKKKEDILEACRKNAITLAERALNRPVLMIDVHIAMQGWMPSMYEGMFCGDKKFPIEALRLRFTNKFRGIRYSTYTQMYGWQSAVKAGEMSGSTGKSLPLSGVRINFEEETDSRKYSISYRVMYSDSSVSDWVSDGEGVYRDNDVIVGFEVKIKEW